MKLIVDYNKWRAGNYGKNMIGVNNTLLLNDNGRSCCLGQIIPQLCPGIEAEDLLNKAMPCDLKMLIPDLTIHSNSTTVKSFENSLLSKNAAIINDSISLTTRERIYKLTNLFDFCGYKLEFINLPGNLD